MCFAMFIPSYSFFIYAILTFFVACKLLLSPSFTAPRATVFTYRYFLHRWPQLCILAIPTDDNEGDCNNKIEAGEKDGESTKHRRRPIGCVVCKIDYDDNEYDMPLDEVAAAASTSTAAANEGNNNNNNSSSSYSGYIGMLAVEKSHRRSGVGTSLVQHAIQRMKQMGCQSIRLETEVSNKGAINLYENRFGFIREELLKKYYLNWGDAYRLRLWLDE